MLRKLGTSLIGQDGLLTTAASTALGYSPMDRIKTRLAAQSEVQGQEKFKQEQDLAARRAEADRLALETNTYNLGRTKTVNAQADAERAAKGAQLAAALVPGPPNPDGSPIISPDAAIGMAEGKLTQYNLDKASGMETMTQGFANELKNLGIDPGVQVGEKFDTSQMDKTLQAFNLDEARKARIQASRESAANRALQRDTMSSYQRAQVNNQIADDYRKEVAPMVVVTNAARRAETIADYIKSNPDALGVGSEAVIADWERMLDPMSVIREGEFTRALSGTPYSARAEVLVQRIVGNGGHLTTETLPQFVDMIRLASQYARERGSARYKDYANLLGGDTRLIGTDPFNEGFPTSGPQGSPSAPPAPRLPGAPLSPPAPTAPGTNLFDNLHRKFPQKR